jgi:hypothetical protein
MNKNLQNRMVDRYYQAFPQACLHDHTDAGIIGWYAQDPVHHEAMVRLKIAEIKRAAQAAKETRG